MLAAFMNYNKVADERIVDLFLQYEDHPAKAIDLFNHVLNAQHIWACRILNKQPDYQVWEEHEPTAYADILALNFSLLEEVLVTVDLEQIVHYTNSQGDKFNNAAKDILLHVFNHSTYHRGQIVALFKANGAIPPVTDYIMLKRNGEL